MYTDLDQFGVVPWAIAPFANWFPTIHLASDVTCANVADENSEAVSDESPTGTGNELREGGGEAGGTTKDAPAGRAAAATPGAAIPPIRTKKETVARVPIPLTLVGGLTS